IIGGLPHAPADIGHVVDAVAHAEPTLPGPPYTAVWAVVQSPAGSGAQAFLEARYIAPVGDWTPSAGSSVTAKTSTVATPASGATARLPFPSASTVKRPAGSGLPPAMAHSS